ncbi:ras guanyl-releasing protein 3-like [Uloborus diversus]|uniref:ras guanyl-releasing protein 3-like n=1 Tax=Uloborus diversus TaxID=327109 RepID=UPI00240975EB|nr:ras guanyl-releasing protein 3-like [Uloborus diversus]
MLPLTQDFILWTDNNYYPAWSITGSNNHVMLLEEERPVVPGVTVRAATVSALVDLLVDSFLPVGGVKEKECSFPRIMMLMHQWFISSEDLAQSLIARFWDGGPIDNCSTSCSHTLREISECAIYHYRSRVCQTLRYWICMFPIHFDLNPPLTTTVKDFQKHLNDQGYGTLADLLDLSKLPSCEWARNLSVRNPPAKHTRKISLVFDHLEASELADHITFLEHKVMRRISFEDFKSYAERGTPQSLPRLERSISLFNSLSQWIQWMVLSKSSPHQRADVVAKFVKVAQRLLQQNNFNSLMSVVGGLSHSCLARLSLTMACVPAETKKALADMSELLASASNFSNYRKTLQEVEGFKIPILGVHMKDLISLHVALPDTLEGGLVNFRKIAQLSLIFGELWELQNSNPRPVNEELVNTLKLSLDTPYTEDELYDLSLLKEPRNYELSLAKEPRNSHSPQSSPTRLSSFSEWGPCGPNADEGTFQRFLRSISEVLLKTYDRDKDGFLSSEEFESMASNFPHIDSFSTLDLDGDGIINQSDLISYLSSSKSKALRVIFQHDFNETTYFKPTFCAHCAGLLWGLIKQGYKCRDCGINSHKHCRELVIMECRRTSSNPTQSDSFATADGLRTKVRLQRPWRRQLKNSQSDNESIQLLDDNCSCDSGFVIADSPEFKDLPPKSPTIRPTPPSPRAPPSPSGCGCQQFQLPRANAQDQDRVSLHPKHAIV